MSARDPHGDLRAPAQATPLQRLAAGAALALLLASAALSTWWILTDRADFGAARGDATLAEPAEAGLP